MGIQKGILLHRKIDSFTDSHLIVEQSKQRLRLKYKKYVPVIVDIFYDHFLANNWNDYSSLDLDTYSRQIYSLVNKNEHILPLNSKMFANYMIEYDILSAYARLEEIERVLQGMSRRAAFVSNMEHAIHDLKEHYSLFENEFKLFFPELRHFVLLQPELNLK